MIPTCLNKNIAEVADRFNGWWLHQPQDRPLLELRVKPTVNRSDKPEHLTWREWALDADARCDEAVHLLRHTPFVAETLPVFRPNVGPDLIAAPYGVEIEFAESTSWARHTLDDISDWAGIRLRQPDFDNPYNRAIDRMTESGLMRGAGEVLVGLPDLHGTYDLMVSLRGPENLCMDMVDDPALIHEVGMHLAEFYRHSLERAWQPFAAVGHPATTWTQFLHDGLAFVASCDFLCLISVDMAREHIEPTFDIENRGVERIIFHLDGPGALRHLDWLLARDDLHAIQWVYGAGNGPAMRWVDVYRRILDAGKSIQVLAASPADALEIVDALGSRGVWITVCDLDSRTEAEDLLLEVESRCSRGKTSL